MRNEFPDVVAPPTGTWAELHPAELLIYLNLKITAKYQQNWSLENIYVQFFLPYLPTYSKQIYRYKLIIIIGPISVDNLDNTAVLSVRFNITSELALALAISSLKLRFGQSEVLVASWIINAVRSSGRPRAVFILEIGGHMPLRPHVFELNKAGNNMDEP